MLKWQEDYYVGEGIKDAEKTKKRIDAGKVALGVYLVTLSENPGNLLEIIPSYMLIQKSYYAKCPEIIGMAKGKDEATDLAVDIVKNIYGETGAFQVNILHDIPPGFGFCAFFAPCAAFQVHPATLGSDPVKSQTG